MIRLNKLSKTYDNGVVALRDLDVSFEPGVFTVVIGSSGAGKSTLLRCINHLEEPTDGTIIVSGVGGLRSRESLRRFRKQTAFIFQQHQLINRHTALRNVLLGAVGRHGLVRSILPMPADEVRLGLASLERVGLLDRAFERADRLSGGQQQRVGIARALVQKAQIILADEPIASLDPTASHRVLSLLRDICHSENIPVITSLHQVDFSRRFADRIIALRHGHLAFDGSAGELTDDIVRDVYQDDGHSELKNPDVVQIA